jgi:DNA repair protein RecN (Recombination protein N)
MLPLNMLKAVTDLLVDVHGQHEHQSLLDEKNHLGVIDAYMQESIAPLKEEVNAVFNEYSGVLARLNSGFLSETERERRIDVLRYQINEIDKAKLSIGEEDKINEELNLLTNAERISDSLNGSYSLLNGEGGAVGLLKKAVDEIGSVSDLSAQYREAYSRLNDLYYELEDAAYSIRDLRPERDFDPRRIDELETRLDVIDGLKHKYGRDVAEVLAFLQSAKAELEELTGDESVRLALEKRKAELLNDYREKAAKLTCARKASAQKLCALAEEQLKSLGMKNAKLGAEFSVIDDEPHENGSDAISLLLSANRGEPLKPLSKVASGGELSRIMLALKTVITDADDIPTLIFDEVDTGISGSTANTVGSKMKRIAGKHQVLCVTHLPQIAAFADAHFFVSKHEENGRTVTDVKRLSDEERPYELARIMGAEAGSKAAVSHAAELIKNASEEGS